MMPKLLRWKVLYNACAQLLRQNNNIEKKKKQETGQPDLNSRWCGSAETILFEKDHSQVLEYLQVAYPISTTNETI